MCSGAEPATAPEPAGQVDQHVDPSTRAAPHEEPRTYKSGVFSSFSRSDNSRRKCVL